MNNLLITMSGGTTCVINATLAGIIGAAQESGAVDCIYGGKDGIPGIFDNELIDLTGLSKDELSRIYRTPASGIIGASRIKPVDSETVSRMDEFFNRNSVKYYFNIGGNGTIQQSIRIAQGISGASVVSIAKTVDNDLGDDEFEKVYYTPGYPSCANYWRHKVEIFNWENLGAHSHDTVLVAQTFGRETGHIAACARLADVERKLPLIILLPEDQRKPAEVVDVVKETIGAHKRAIIVMSEGYAISNIGERHDLSGQIMYGTSQTTQAQNLVNLLFENGIQGRAFIPGFDQRDEILLATELDLKRAHDVGKYALEQALDGKKNFLASISLVDGVVRYTMIPFSDIGVFSRALPNRWVKYGHFDVTDEYLDYALPLIQG